MAQSNGVSASVEEARAKVNELAREAYQKADGTRKDAVKKLFEAADEIRERAREGSAEARESANAIARNLERAANYLNSRTIDNVEEASEAVRENAFKTVIVALVIGILIGLWLRRN